MNSKEIIQEAGADLLKALWLCGGYYECPKDPDDGKRLGPLVGYAGRYTDGTKQKQFVGDVYANFAKMDPFSQVLEYFAIGLDSDLSCLGEAVFCGMPVGGYSFAQMLGNVYDFRVIKAEKKVTALATETSREKTKLVFARYEIEPGMRIILVEDVCNNFSTADQAIDLVVNGGGTVAGIACLLNRSQVKSYRGIPVISYLFKPMPEYIQSDPAVANDVLRGNVVWKPKDDWPRLMAIMKERMR